MAKNKELETIIKIKGKVDASVGKSFDAVEKAAGSALKNLPGTIMKGVGAVAKGVAVAGAAAAGAAVAGGKALLDLGTEFDKASDTIRIGTGATGEALEALNKDFEAVYSAVPTSMEDASKAIADYNTRLGLTGEPLQALSEQALQVSNLLGEDLDAVIEESSQAFQQWDIDGEKMGDAMDYVFKASQSTGAGFTELMSNVQQFGPQMQELGFSFEESTALLGQLDKAGVNSGEVMGALKKSVTIMAKDGLGAAEGLDLYMEKIKNAGTETEATAIAAEVFGSRAGSTMAAAIRDGQLSIDDLTKSLQASDETIQKAAEDTMDFPEKLQLLKQKAQVALKPVANSLFDQLNNAMPYVEQAIEKVMPIITDLAGRLGDTFAAVMPVILDVFEQVSGWIGDNLPGILDTVQSVIGGILDIALPVIEQIGGVLADTIVPLIETLMPYIQQIGDHVMSLYEALAPLIGDILSFIIPILGQVAESVLPIIMTAIDMLIVHITNIIEFVRNVFTGNWEGAWQNIKNIFNNFFDGFKKIIELWLDYFKKIPEILASVFELLRPILEGFAELWSKIWTGIKETFEKIWTGLSGIVKTAFNAVIGVINGAVGGINSILSGAMNMIKKIPGIEKIFGGSLPDLQIPEIPYLAKGGTITSPTLAMVGEAGPETVVPHNNTPRSRALLAEASRGVYGGSQNTYNVTFAPQISGDNAGEIAELTMQKFKAFMAQYQRDNTREAFA